MVIKATFSVSGIFQLYRGCQFYWLRKPEYAEKTTDLSKVTDKLHSLIDKSQLFYYIQIISLSFTLE